MDVLSSGDLRRPRLTLALGVALALAVLAAALAAVLLRPRELPSTASLEVLPNGYSYATEGDRASVGFQLRNTGDVPLRVAGVGADLPGLRLVDVVASGEPFRFSAVGAGASALPAFSLAPGTVIEVNLVYGVVGCDDVPRDARTVPVRVREGWARGVLRLPLPGQPAAAPDAGPDDEDPWQQVLVRDLCG